MEKTWIGIKRGLLQPKHREAMGVRVWLYMHMIDIVDWDTGRIEGWKDGEQAKAIEMPWRTVQKQRQELVEQGYIVCEQGFQCLNIIITKWVNPRKYSGEIITPKGTQKSVPSTSQGTQISVPIHAENSVPFLITHINTIYGAEVPESLQTEEFSTAWFEWEDHRKDKKKKLTPVSVKKQIDLLARFAPHAAAMINKSILNGWQGLFEPDQRDLTADKPGTVAVSNNGGMKL